MREINLGVQVLRPALASGARGALPLVGGRHNYVGVLLLSCPSHNLFPLAGACLCPLCNCGQVVSRTGLV